MSILIVQKKFRFLNSFAISFPPSLISNSTLSGNPSMSPGNTSSTPGNIILQFVAKNTLNCFF